MASLLAATKSLIVKQSVRVASYSSSRKLNFQRTMFKENGGEPKFPSIDRTIQQIKNAKVLNDTTGQGFGERGDKGEEGGKKSVFEDHVEFPSEFMIKIIGLNEPTFVIDILNSVATIVNVAPEKIAFTTKETAGGKYLSISIKPYFKDASEVYAAYDIVSKDTRVKFVI